MDYIYSELDTTAIDFSNCLIYHNYKELPEPDESIYKRIAFVSEDYGSELKADAMYICLKIDGEYVWVNALSSGVDDEVIKILTERVDLLEETKADSSEVDEAIDAVIKLIDNVRIFLLNRIQETYNQVLEDISPLIVNISREDSSESEYGYILTLDKTWNEINNAYIFGKNVLGKYWPEWETEALYYPPRALYPLVGVGILNPTTYVVYTGDGTFTTDDPDGYPVISKTPDEGELVPVDLTVISDSITIETSEGLVYALNSSSSLVITAYADYAGDYEVEWQSSAINGEITDFLYMQSGKTLTVVWNPESDVLDSEVAISAKLKDIPSLWSEPIYVTKVVNF